MTKSGEIYARGLNSHGQLGLGDEKNRNSPQKVKLEPVKMIRCGAFHTVALTKTGDVYSWGSNMHGQLGFDHRKCQIFPEQINLTNIQMIACGFKHTIFVNNSNEIYSCGNNQYGQLGRSLDKYKYLLNKVNLKIDHGDSILSVSCGYHTMILTKFNKIYVWGNNNYGQLGLGYPIDQFIPQILNLEIGLDSIILISCGDEHTMALTKFNKIYAWGRFCEGQLAININYEYIHTPQKINSIFLNELEFITISCGNQHTVAVTKFNEIYMWGKNYRQQLGISPNENKNFPFKLDF